MHGTAIFGLDFAFLDLGFLNLELGKSWLGHADREASRRKNG
ncbi:MAG: hypothetical protein R3D01_01170 [Hyphomicrobiales bacterium]